MEDASRLSASIPQLCGMFARQGGPLTHRPPLSGEPPVTSLSLSSLSRSSSLLLFLSLSIPLSSSLFFSPSLSLSLSLYLSMSLSPLPLSFLSPFHLSLPGPLFSFFPRSSHTVPPPLNLKSVRDVKSSSTLVVSLPLSSPLCVCADSYGTRSSSA